MELPAAANDKTAPQRIAIRHPGGVGEILHDADGGSWLRGVMVEPETENSAALSDGTSEIPFVAIA